MYPCGPIKGYMVRGANLEDGLKMEAEVTVEMFFGIYLARTTKCLL